MVDQEITVRVFGDDGRQIFFERQILPAMPRRVKHIVLAVRAALSEMYP